jgi:replicative DNA helicase
VKTPDILVLERMLFQGQDATEKLSELVDPAAFQTKCARNLFLFFAREAPHGFSEGSIRPLIVAELPECLSLFDSLSDELRPDDSSHESLANALLHWGQMERLRRAAASVDKEFSKGKTYAEVRSNLDERLTGIDLSALKDKPYDDKKDMARRVNEYLHGDSDSVRGLPFGLVKLDRKVTPILTGNLVIVGGRPGVGKTLVMKNLCRNAVVLYDEPCAYFTFEMLGDEMLPSFACMDSGLSYIDYIRRQFSSVQLNRFIDSLNRWVENPLFKLNERSHVTPEWILATMKRYRAEGITTFFIDHLHRVHYEPNAKGDIRLAIGTFARQLKSFAVDYGARVVVGAQLTKGNKHEEPSDEMIREANNILEEADKIILKWKAMVAGARDNNGKFHPTLGQNGQRILAHDAPKGAEIAEDQERVYLKLEKMRIVDGEGVIALPVNPKSGLIYEETHHESEEYAA